MPNMVVIAIAVVIAMGSMQLRLPLQSSMPLQLPSIVNAIAIAIMTITLMANCCHKPFMMLFTMAIITVVIATVTVCIVKTKPLFYVLLGALVVIPKTYMTGFSQDPNIHHLAVGAWCVVSLDLMVVGFYGKKRFSLDL